MQAAGSSVQPPAPLRVLVRKALDPGGLLPIGVGGLELTKPAV